MRLCGSALPGSLRRRALGQRRLEEVFVFGFSDGILLNNTLLL